MTTPACSERTNERIFAPVDAGQMRAGPPISEPRQALDAVHNEGGAPSIRSSGLAFLRLLARRKGSRDDRPRVTDLREPPGVVRSGSFALGPFCPLPAGVEELHDEDQEREGDADHENHEGAANGLQRHCERGRTVVAPEALAAILGGVFVRPALDDAALKEVVDPAIGERSELHSIAD